MVLELVNPHVPTIQGLIQQWLIFLAFLNSFAMIYVVWYKHNTLFQKFETVSMRIFYLNGVWLFFLTLVPFATGFECDLFPDNASVEYHFFNKEHEISILYL